MRYESTELKWKLLRMQAGVSRQESSRWLLAQTRQLTKSENRLDFGVDGDVRGGDAVDGILLAA